MALTVALTKNPEQNRHSLAMYVFTPTDWGWFGHLVVGVHILSVVFAIAEPLGCRYDFYGSATLIDGLTFSFHYNQG